MKAIGIEDSLAYEYWTVQLPHLREGTSYDFPSDQTPTYFSAGGSAWVVHGRGFFGVMPSGNLTIGKVADGAHWSMWTYA